MNMFIVLALETNLFSNILQELLKIYFKIHLLLPYILVQTDLCTGRVRAAKIPSKLVTFI